MIEYLKKGVLVDVVANVFKTMAKLEVRPNIASPNILPVAVMVGLGGDEKRMAVIMRMGEALALRSAGAMLEDKTMSWGPAAEDAVSELCNIIAGNLKPHIRSGLSLSLPILVHGSDFAIRSPRLAVCQSESFECDGEFLVVVLAREE